MWDDAVGKLTIRRPNGQSYSVRGTEITSGGHRVFGVETVGNEIHVLTGPKFNQQPTRRVKFSDSGMYKGNTGL